MNKRPASDILTDAAPDLRTQPHTWHGLFIQLIHISTIIGWLEGKLRPIVDEYAYARMLIHLKNAENWARALVARDAAGQALQHQASTSPPGAPQTETAKPNALPALPLLPPLARAHHSARNTPAPKPDHPFNRHITQMKDTAPLAARYHRLMEMVENPEAQVQRYLKLQARRAANPTPIRTKAPTKRAREAKHGQSLTPDEIDEKLDEISNVIDRLETIPTIDTS